MEMNGERNNNSPRTRRRPAIAAESYNPQLDDDAESIVFHPKTEEQLACLEEVANNIILFQNCDVEQKKILYNAMFERRVEQDEVIIREGDEGDNFYIIEKGEYHIHRRDKKVVILYDKGYFGELALLYNCTRNATIIAKSPGILWGLDQKTFRQIVVSATAKRRRDFEDLLRSVPVLNTLTENEFMNLTDALGEVRFMRNDCIIKEGEIADKMYIIMEGEVSIRVQLRDSDEEREIAKLKRGQYFGELALVLNRPRVASVYSIMDGTKCAVLDVFAFERLLGPSAEIMKRNVTNFNLERKLLGVDFISMDVNLI